MAAISEELEHLRLSSVDEALRLRLHSLLRSLRHAAERMAALLLTRRSEDELLMRDALQGIRKQLSVLEDFALSASPMHERIQRVMQLSGRSMRMMTRSMDLLSATSEQRVFRAYPVTKTMYMLHPRHLMSGIRNLFSVDSHTARYATRTAVTAALATAIYKWWHIDHGYWLAFTVIIVMQPHFIATLRKGVDRLIGTIGGGIVGGLLIHLPAGLHIKEVMLFVSAVAMIYFFRMQYRISAFFITLNLVVLFSVSQELNNMLILIRAGATLGGAIIAVAAGFLLLPNWDRKFLPRLMAEALERNWAYFQLSFAEADTARHGDWTRTKRQAEVSNSNAYDSFTRALQEPGGLRRAFSGYYEFITHSVRITRELNNIHLEEESKSGDQPPADAETVELIRSCATLFLDLLSRVGELDGAVRKSLPSFSEPAQLPSLNAAQKHYLCRLQSELRFLMQNLLELSPQAGAAQKRTVLPVPSRS